MSAQSDTLHHKNITIIVPVFNEGKNILSNLDLLISEVEPYFANYEIIVISDGSTDDTNLQLQSHNHPKLRIILLDKNRGKGHAIRQGFFEAKGDYIFFIDGGMELHPKEIKIFLGLMELYDAHIILGSKRHPQSQVYYPPTRKLLSLCYQFLVMLFFDLDITDTQVGMKLFKREVVETIRSELSIDRYGFDLEILALAKRKGFIRMLEAPIRLDYFGGGKRAFFQDLLHVVYVAWLVFHDTLRVYWKLKKTIH